MNRNVHQNIVASRCIDNQFRIESLTSESELNRIVRCQGITTPTIRQGQKDLGPVHTSPGNFATVKLCSWFD